ncbi:hypothetical protein Tco_0627044 [Tanacetum coccineum]|uniref:Uncharacterized protein n=1 Tax=Tanacetum coccineum TaxID=301880 RepID=A0ABQ4WLE0_9ASTR
MATRPRALLENFQNDDQFKNHRLVCCQEDASKQGRIKIVDETQGRLDDAEMFDTDDLHGDEVIVDMAVDKPMSCLLCCATTTTDKTKARGVVVQEPKKDQVALDEEMARNLKAQLQDELIEEEKMARKKEEEANIALIESWENTQAIMEADRLLAERLPTRGARGVKGIDREDLQTLWKMVKTKYGDIRLEDEHERVVLRRFLKVQVLLLVEVKSSSEVKDWKYDAK